MSLSERLQGELTEAMKRKDALKVSVLRMTKAALKYKEIELRKPLSLEEENQVLLTLVKQRTESIETFEKGGRADLAEKEAAERDLIRAYLPEAVSEAEIERVVGETVKDLGAASAKDVGAVMKEALQRLKATGKTVDGKAVNAAVRAKLS
ncbi:MAG TPA: GatB/YqeY domain-containing protein [Vicinamibacteria bacterium]|nr:GatB/YqeY domain-containing protein [Vicinamibacteria bacterium]